MSSVGSPFPRFLSGISWLFKALLQAPPHTPPRARKSRGAERFCALQPPPQGRRESFLTATLAAQVYTLCLALLPLQVAVLQQKDPRTSPCSSSYKDPKSPIERLQIDTWLTIDEHCSVLHFRAIYLYVSYISPYLYLSLYISCMYPFVLLSI